ncbi:PstC family ABC transporter permease [Xylanimonas ulmi]|uniref:Phosphate transport system permease protein n=1 Tax=Xylanimonas ulmi TaxID=228973 RepID=A0A4Q7M3K4_9MICO|nr:phosphate ABC transporter membrane protein 1 (PhoT family) [Xylanibacterium ulmi]
MTTTASPPPLTGGSPRRRGRGAERGFSRGFRWISTGSGIVLLVVLAAVAIFLVQQAMPALTAGSDELVAQNVLPQGMTSLWQLIVPLVFGTLVAALLALVIATPIAVGIALYISHYAPRRVSAAVGYLVDLLAAIPSVVYGLWGGMTLAPVIRVVWSWIAQALSVLPFWDVRATATGRSVATASVVLAVMILPIITAVSREVFKQTPRLHEEAALALGATEWEVIKTAVLPFGRSGVISAAMLGLGRALGETMAVLMILSPGILVSFQIFDAGQQQTIAAFIASQFPEAAGLRVNVLIATGLALFVITMLVNMAARWIVSRRKDFSGAN